jgi:hypothetical protein
MDPQLITWTVAGGTIVFVTGVVSAIGSRYQRKSRKVRAPIEREIKPQEAAVKQESSDGAMKAAASGREEFAQISGNTR